MNNKDNLVIELVVNNHAGVMSHITGLFSRRAFNLEGILCGRIGESDTSRMYLLVNNDDFLEQIIKQLNKLYDVLEVRVHDQFNQDVFENLDKLLTGK